MSRDELSHDLQDELIRKKSSLENDLQMRSAQIVDMQQKIVEEDAGK